jgi:hypothetical protein
MLYLNDNTWSRFNRLTFNGQGTATVDVDQSWDNSTGYFDLGNEYADDVFENAGISFDAAIWAMGAPTPRCCATSS